jgi:hypothetical protein
VSSAWSFPWFVALAGLVVASPGLLLVDIAGCSTHEGGACGLQRWTLGLCLGIVTSTMVYAAFALVQLRALFPAWPAASLIWLVRRRFHQPSFAAVPAWAPAVVILVALALAPFLFLPIYWRNFALAGGGGLTFNGLPDVVLHASLAQELTHTVPPTIPFLPGVPCRYHYGMDLFTALFRGIGGLSIPDLSARFVPTLLMATTVLAAFCLNRAWLASPWAALLATALMLFGEDLSFIPGLLLGSHLWAAKIFQAPAVFSLYYLNPLLPALGLLCATLLCLHRYSESGRGGWLVLTALASAGLTEWKVFAGAQLLAAVGIAGLYRLARWRDTRLLRAFVASAFAQLPFVVWGLQAQAGRSTVVWQQWPYVRHLFEQLGIWMAPAFAPIRAYAEGTRGVSRVAAFWLVGVGTYLFGTLGMRLLAIPAMLWEPERPSWRPVRQVAIAFAVLGPVLSLTLIVVPAGSGLAAQYNNGIWFLVQSKFLFWPFAVEFLWRVTSASASRRWLAAVIVLALSVPSSAEFFVYQFRHMGARTLDPDLLDTLRFLGAEAAPGTVVVARAGPLLPLLCMTSCRGLTLQIYADVQLGRHEIASRRAELRGFWSAWNDGALDEAFLSRLGAAYILVDRAVDTASPGAGQVQRVEGHTLRLEPLLEKPRYALYQVHRR